MSGNLDTMARSKNRRRKATPRRASDAPRAVPPPQPTTQLAPAAHSTPAADLDPHWLLTDPLRIKVDPLGALQAARQLRTNLAAEEATAVQIARQAGHSWAKVGDALGISRQAAHERFSPPATAPNATAR